MNDTNFQILPLRIIKKKYTNVCITFLQHQQLKLNTEVIRNNLRQINDFNDSRKLKYRSTGGLGLPNLTDFFNSMGMTWFRRMGNSKSFWLTMLNEQIRAKPYSIPSLSEFTLETETQYTRKIVYGQIS